MANLAYVFETHSIQNYILDTGRLADMVGASALVESLLDAPLTACLDALGFSRDEQSTLFARRAGGSFIALLDDPSRAADLRDLWGLTVAAYAPGLSFSHQIAEGGTPLDAVRAAMEGLRQQRNAPSVVLPEAGPLVQRAPRTGQPAVANLHLPKGREYVDAATQRKRDRQFRQAESLTRHFAAEGCTWPTTFDATGSERDVLFPFSGENRHVGVIHADGNGLGMLIHQLQKQWQAKPDDYRELAWRFSTAVTDATRAAAAHATAQVLRPHARDGVMPARPLVLGGDDLTMIIRADLALPFTEAFIAAFEEASARLVTPLLQAGGIAQDGLTACAGIAYVKASYPFQLAYALAEDLCASAKSASRRVSAENESIPSSIAMRRVTTSQVGGFDELLERELTITDGAERFMLTMGAYGTGRLAANLPTLANLKTLQHIMEDARLPGGATRHLLTLLHESPSQARQRYERWRAVMSGNAASKALLGQFDAALGGLLGNLQQDLPFSDDTPAVTPLADALALSAVGSLTHA